VKKSAYYYDISSADCFGCQWEEMKNSCRKMGMGTKFDYENGMGMGKKSWEWGQMGIKKSLLVQ